MISREDALGRDHRSFAIASGGAAVCVGIAVATGSYIAIGGCAVAVFWTFAVAVLSNEAIALLVIGALTLVPEVRGVSGLEIMTPVLILRLPQHGWKAVDIQLRRLLTPLWLLACLAALSLLSVIANEPHSLGQIVLRVVRLQEVALAATFLVIVAVRTGHELSAAIALAIGAGSAIAVAMFAAQVALSSSQQFIAIGGRELIRAAGVHGDTSSFAFQEGLGLLILSGLIATPRRTRRIGMLLILAVSGLVAAGIVLSFSRTALLGSLIALVVATGIRLRSRGSRGARPLIAVCGVAVLLALLNPFGLATRAAAPWHLRVTQTQSLQDARLRNWSSTIHRLTPLTAVVGTGYKAGILGDQTPPDNNYLSALSELGVAGLVIVVVLVVRIARLRGGYDVALARGLGVFIAFSMLFGDVFTYWRSVPLLFGALAASLSVGRERAS